MIIDAHVHLPCYEDSLVTYEDKKQRLILDLKNCGVDGAVVIADSELSSAIGTTSECVELFLDTPNIFVMGGISPLIEYESRLQQLEGFLKHRDIIALKLYPGHEAYYLNDSRLEDTFELCEKYDVPLAVHTGWSNAQYNRPDYFAQIAKNHPELRIVICHMCWPDIDFCYDITAGHRNIYYDISSLAHQVNLTEKTSVSLTCIAQLSSDRIIMASDYGACSIAAHIELIKSLSISEEKKQAILYKNAIDLYKLNMPVV